MRAEMVIARSQNMLSSSYVLVQTWKQRRRKCGFLSSLASWLRCSSSARDQAKRIMKVHGAHSSGASILNMNDAACAALKCALMRSMERAATQFALPILDITPPRSRQPNAGSHRDKNILSDPSKPHGGELGDHDVIPMDAGSAQWTACGRPARNFTSLSS